MIKVNAPEPLQGQYLLTVMKRGRIGNRGVLTRFARMQHVVRRSSNSRTDRRSCEHPLERSLNPDLGSVTACPPRAGNARPQVPP